MLGEHFRDGAVWGLRGCARLHGADALESRSDPRMVEHLGTEQIEE